MSVHVCGECMRLGCECVWCVSMSACVVSACVYCECDATGGLGQREDSAGSRGLMPGAPGRIQAGGPQGCAWCLGAPTPPAAAVKTERATGRRSAPASVCSEGAALPGPSHTAGTEHQPPRRRSAQASRPHCGHLPVQNTQKQDRQAS